MENHYKNNTFHVNYVIYEKNDTAILLDGVVTKNHKQYFTAIPINPVNFSYLCERAIGFEKRNQTYPQLTDHYFTGDYPVKPIDELGDNKITQLSLLSTASNN